MRPILASVALLAFSLPAFGQTSGSTPQSDGAPGASIKDLLSGSSHPLTLKLKDLNGDWRRLTLSGAVDNGGFSQFMTTLFGGSNDAVYTKGETVVLGEQTYIVAYRVKPKPLDMTALIKDKPDFTAFLPEKLTEETTLSFSLINLRTAGNLQDLRAVDVKEEIAESNASSGGLLGALLPAIMSGMGGAGGMNPFGGAKADDASGDISVGGADTATPPLSTASVAQPRVSSVAGVKLVFLNDKILHSSGNQINVELANNKLVLKGHVRNSAISARAAKLARKVLENQASDLEVVNHLTVSTRH